MAEPTRIRPDKAQAKVAGGNALLVCAYDDEDKCSRMRLQGALSLNEFKSRLTTMPRDQEIIFYCA